MDKNFWLSVFISFSFLIGGFACLHYGLVGYGISLFVFLPLILGYLYGNSSYRKASLFGLIFSLAMFFFLLMIGQLEGMMCILMSFPIIFISIVIGAAIKGIVSAIRKPQDDQNTLKSSILPFLLFVLFGFSENQLTKNDHPTINISSEIVYDHSAMDVYDAIKSVDTLDGPKPLLLKIDLPVPQKCILEEEKVGAQRVCIFEGGNIVQKITELDPGKILKMDVVDYQLTGRDWLGFVEAAYVFEELENNRCKMTRITTYTSELYPRFYWAPLEKWGIEQEHEFVFNCLKIDLEENQ